MIPTLRASFFLLGLVTASTSIFAQDSSGIQTLLLEPKDTARDSRTVPLKIFFSPAKASEPIPVVLFSHGLGGSREGGQYLGEGWAKAGYIAIFLQHPGSDESLWKGARPAGRMEALRKGASAKSFIERIGDVTFILDLLEQWNVEEDHPLAGKMNLDQIGMSGHSFGAVTTQTVMGNKMAFGKDFEDPRLKAFVIMSPSVPKSRTAEEAYGHITNPALCMTGTEDGDPMARPGEAPGNSPEARRKVYTGLPDGDKYELVFEAGTHDVFSGRTLRSGEKDSRFHSAIVKLSTHFWDAYLKDDSTAKRWLQSETAKSESGLIPEDVWRWK